MTENDNKSIVEFLEEFSFLKLLKKKEISKWEKDLIRKIWDLKIKEDGIRLSGDTVKKMIREFALNNRNDLEKKISIKQDGEEGA